MQSFFALQHTAIFNTVWNSFFCNISTDKTPFAKEFKGIVSQDFDWLQMILMNKTWIPDVPLEVYCFFKFSLSYSFFKFKVLSGLSYF